MESVECLPVIKIRFLPRVKWLVNDRTVFSQVLSTNGWLAPLQCQQESPIWGAGRKLSSLQNSSIVIQQGCEAASLASLLLNGLPCSAPSCSALCCVICSADLICSIPFHSALAGTGLFHSAPRDSLSVLARPGKRSPSLLWKENSQSRGELAYMDGSPHPWSLIGLSSCQ